MARFFESICALFIVYLVQLDNKHLLSVHQWEGPYWEKLCPESLVLPKAIGQGSTQDRDTRHNFSQFRST